MSKGKFVNRKSIATKAMVMILAVMLIVGISVGGTLAWLTATTETVTNTFTVGDIKISLAETTGESYKVVPGDTIAKDPKVTVTGGSEACWLFVRVAETNNAITDKANDNQIINWTVDTAAGTGWTAVPEHDGYWYKEVSAKTKDQEFYVFADGIADDEKTGSVTVSTLVIKGQINADNQPVITVTAAAVQKDNVANVADAFAKLPDAFTA